MRISDWSSDVCSSDLPIRIPLERAHGLQQGKRMQLVVVVQQGHVLSERDPESRVRCFCDMAIAVTRHVTDPRIRGGVLGQYPGDMWLRRSVVGYTQLPCRIDLRPNEIGRAHV